MPQDEARFRVGFVPGVTPDKWARAWADRMPRRPLDLVPLTDEDGVALLRSADLAMCFVRLPVDRTGLHLIPLYDERPVVVVSREHPVAAYDVIDVADLADEHLLQDPDDVPAWRDLATEVREGTRFPVPPMTLRQAVESVAADAGIVVVPMSLARLHHRKDVTHVPVTGVPTTQVGLAWPQDADDDRIETFIGVVRGRTANSSRSAPAPSGSREGPRKPRRRA
jgi:DNA-binding transcriptional LysR family regulator